MTPHESTLFSTAMKLACLEARKWIGATSPNPPVGATALDENGGVLAVTAHIQAGTEHAEAALLRLCLEQGLISRLHTVCVTLEPCNHHGRTPPCSEALIAAGVRRVVIGTHDPNRHVKGGGAKGLEEAGVDVIKGVEEDMCLQLIHVFSFHAKTGKPFVTVKRAFDSSGSMIPPEGQKTFTDPSSLLLAHRLRKKADAIITGSGTVLADIPEFTVRHVKDVPDKRRILGLLDRRHRVSDAYINQAKLRGFDIRRYETLESCLHDLEKKQVRDILVEAGPLLSQSVLESPHWSLCIDIHKGAPDKFSVRINPAAQLPFDEATLNLDWILPS